MDKPLRKFVQDQLSVWPLAAANFRSLKTARIRHFNINGLDCSLQFNPCRIASSTADTAPEKLLSRPCFLCEGNRPPEQFHLKFQGRKNRSYNIQVNPYPIFPDHLVIARDRHIPQAIWHHLPDMLDFVRQYGSYTVFYNGPQSGASAPDHLHFQACPRHLLPLENAVESFLEHPGRQLASLKDADLYHFKAYTSGVFVLKATTAKSLTKLFYRLLECCDRKPADTEPRFNMYCFYGKVGYSAFVVMRSSSRSHHYYSDGEDHLTISPGAADMAGMFVTPFREDFEKADGKLLSEIVAEVSVSPEEEARILQRLTRTQQSIEVGIMEGDQICFEIISDGAGPQKVSLCDGRINYNGMLYDELVFDSITRSTLFSEPSFILYDVTIGIGFHWERKRTLKFAGSLRFRVVGGKICAVNRVGLEDYLLSVISSEMKSSASLELLRAHAVISRSWVLSNLGRHEGYDVCADDHCQRYQGLTMAVGEKVRQAIDQTWGQVLRCNGSLCDTRYSKCCGGTTELFSTCWEDRDYPYLQAVEDTVPGRAGHFCDCKDPAILSQVLNDYDLEAGDFYKWEQSYDRKHLSELLKRRTGIDFGMVKDLVPVEKGPSGRIKYLRIEGTLRTGTIGKELAIRHALSESHLRSSAFEIIWNGDTVTLRGRGWGHGVGLCQVGAAVMASEGYGYREILSHYYPESDVE